MADNKFADSDILFEPFGKMPDGRAVMRHTISNDNGMSMSVIDFGATITQLIIPTAQPVDVVLGFDSIEDYIRSSQLPAPPHFGAAIGRFAGRISNANFSIDGKRYELDANNGPNTLHGGRRGFDKVLWDVIEQTKNSIVFFYRSPDGDQHFPGEMDVTVKYTLTNQNEVTIEYGATTDQDTVINLTQHSYFNLDGYDGNVVDQDLMINAGKILEIDNANIPSGKLVDAAEKGFDFRTFGKVPTKIDDSFIIENPALPAAKLKSAKTGIAMTVISDQATLHIYVGGDLFGKFKGKRGVAYHPTSGICFESQNYTNAPNRPEFPSALLKSGERYSQRTIWKFEW